MILERHNLYSIDGGPIKNALAHFSNIEENAFYFNEDSYKEIDSNYLTACLLMAAKLAIQANKDDKNINRIILRFNISE